MNRRPALAGFTAAIALMLAPACAQAGDLTVVMRDARGAPVADAVVTVSVPGRKAPAHYAQPLRMSQRNLMFSPLVLVAPVGAEVNFDNEDAVRHQVYSFSPAKKFELKLFGKDQSHSVRFDKAGAVALGCNIHDNMVAYVRVTDAAYAQVTDGSGRVVFHDVPAGSAKVGVWQPYLRAPGNELSAEVAVPRSGGVERDFAGPVLPPRR